MPPELASYAAVFLGVAALCYGYRSVTALRVLRSSPVGENGPASLVDGERVALTGELVVEEPVESAAAAVENTDRAVGASVWRARYPDHTNSDITIENYGWEGQSWVTFASGIEWGRFGVDVDGRFVRIDPSWLRETLETRPLSAVDIRGSLQGDRFATYLWNCLYTHLRGRTYHRSLRQFTDHVQPVGDVDPDRYLVETRPLLEGMTVGVSGELRVESGEPVLGGSDETPLLVSDQGLAAHRHRLRHRATWKGTVALGAALLAASLWAEFYLPVVLLVAVCLVYIVYELLRDAGALLARVWN